MYKNRSFLAFIPARGGSKGIPHKNIALVNGRPLLDYTVQSARASRYLDAVVVSTDDDEIAAAAKASGAQVIMRPPELALDTSRTIDAVLHALSLTKPTYDYLVLLQPTQPLRRAEHIDGAIEQIVDTGVTALLSVSPAKNHPILLRTMEESSKRLRPLLHTSSTVRRQDFPPCYVVNGAIYINLTACIDASTSFNDNPYAYVMDTRYDLDVDEPYDLDLLEKIVKEEATHAVLKEAKK